MKLLTKYIFLISWVALSIPSLHTPARADVLWTSPPTGSLITESPLRVYGYLYGDLEGITEVTLETTRSDAARKTYFPEVIEGKMFSVNLELEPGLNTVKAGGDELLLLYKPGSTAEQEGDFKRPAIHKVTPDCQKCHGTRGKQLTLLDNVPDLCEKCHDDLGHELLQYSFKRGVHFKTITPNCLECHDHHASLEPYRGTVEGNICTACHSEHDASSHDKPGEVSCRTCHDSHNSAYANLLVNDPEKICLECHTDVWKPKGQRLSRHKPAQRKKCYDCHAPHDVGNRMQLREPVPTLCFNCHDNVKDDIHSGELRECRICHEPHSSENKRLLANNIDSYCLECHDDYEGDESHPALEEGCIVCHNPHKDARKADSRVVCGKCHSVVRSSFSQSHGELSMEKVSQCSLCHPPHESKYDHNLYGKPHYPLRSGGCRTCHEAGEGDELKLRYEGNENCVRCHGSTVGMSTIVEQDKVHKPILQMDCIACHNPHLESREFMLLDDVTTLCNWCHGLLTMGANNVHGALKDNDCRACHVPHLSDTQPLLKASQREICKECHSDKFPETRREKKLLHGALKDECTTCHNPHAQNNDNLLIDDKARLCIKCHEKALQDEKGQPLKYLHGPVGTGDCTACHELKHFHDRRGDNFLKEQGSKICAYCHDTGEEHVPRQYQSRLIKFGNDCMKCHNPHGEKNKFMLIIEAK